MKPKVTRTYGPIHFHDLDPHRFEDLVRQLIYDFKDWQNIEATGRSGNDDGFDVRAYEKVNIVSEVEENGDTTKVVYPMEGNLWMIQGKREKAIGPKKLKGILSDVDPDNPPYGYILAASANFSKKSYDVFREELRKRGVMEFYLWGEAELEDMLYLPKNDRILFTFFGFSLVSKRRSRTTEIRAAVSVKNKLYRSLGEGEIYNHILIRDLKDTHYPYESEYKDFDNRPRWKEYIAFGYHPRGLLCHNHEYLAYIDTERKEFDFTKEIDFIYPQNEDQDKWKERMDKQKLVNDVYDYFPKHKQGRVALEGLVRYDDITLIDDKGDEWNNFPHIYVDFVGEKGPFSGGYDFLKIGEINVGIVSEYKRIKVFPNKFEKKKDGKIHEKKTISLDHETWRAIDNSKIDAIFDTKDQCASLKPRDIISVTLSGKDNEKRMIQITYVCKVKIVDYLKLHERNFLLRRSAELQLMDEFNEGAVVNVYEFKRIY